MGIWSEIQREINWKCVSGSAAVSVLKDCGKKDGDESIRKQS